MQVTSHPIDAVNTLLKVEIQEADYADKVEQELKNYAKQASLPGFRKGHVPLALIRKKSGLSVKLDQLNKIVGEAMQRYLTTEKLEFFGHPIPSSKPVTLEEKDFTLEFELGLKPEFSINLNAKENFPFYEILTTEEEVSKYIHTERKHGDETTLETISPDADDIKIEFKTDAGDEETGWLPLEEFSEAARRLLSGKKIADSVQLDTNDIFSEEYDGYWPRKIEELGKTTPTLAVVIKDIRKVGLLEMNQDFFDRMAGKGAVSSEEELKRYVANRFEASRKELSESFFFTSVLDKLLKDADIKLPKEFLKKMIAENHGRHEHAMDEKAVEVEYALSEPQIKKALIESKLIAQYGISNKEKDVDDYIEQRIRQNIAMSGKEDVDEAGLHGFIRSIKEDEKSYERWYEDFTRSKLLELFREKLTVKTEKISQKEFADLRRKQLSPAE